MKYDSDKLLLVLDLTGILVFGVEGAMAAIGGDLDFFGLMVLAFTTALAGGIIRDLLIGAIPPQSLRDWRYGTTAFVGGALVFFLHEFVVRIPSPLILGLDAAACRCSQLREQLRRWITACTRLLRFCWAELRVWEAEPCGTFF